MKNKLDLKRVVQLIHGGKTVGSMKEIEALLSASGHAKESKILRVTIEQEQRLGAFVDDFIRTGVADLHLIGTPEQIQSYNDCSSEALDHFRDTHKVLFEWFESQPRMPLDDRTKHWNLRRLTRELVGLPHDHLPGQPLIERDVITDFHALIDMAKTGKGACLLLMSIVRDMLLEQEQGPILGEPLEELPNGKFFMGLKEKMDSLNPADAAKGLGALLAIVAAILAQHLGLLGEFSWMTVVFVVIAVLANIVLGLTKHKLDEIEDASRESGVPVRTIALHYTAKLSQAASFVASRYARNAAVGQIIAAGTNVGALAIFDLPRSIISALALSAYGFIPSFDTIQASASTVGALNYDAVKETVYHRAGSVGTLFDWVFGEDAIIRIAGVSGIAVIGVYCLYNFGALWRLTRWGVGKITSASRHLPGIILGVASVRVQNDIIRRWKESYLDGTMLALAELSTLCAAYYATGDQTFWSFLSRYFGEDVGMVIKGSTVSLGVLRMIYSVGVHCSVKSEKLFRGIVRSKLNRVQSMLVNPESWPRLLSIIMFATNYYSVQPTTLRNSPVIPREILDLSLPTTIDRDLDEVFNSIEEASGFNEAESKLIRRVGIQSFVDGLIPLIEKQFNGMRFDPPYTIFKNDTASGTVVFEDVTNTDDDSLTTRDGAEDRMLALQIKVARKLLASNLTPVSISDDDVRDANIRRLALDTGIWVTSASALISFFEWVRLSMTVKTLLPRPPAADRRQTHPCLYDVVDNPPYDGQIWASMIYNVHDLPSELQKLVIRQTERYIKPVPVHSPNETPGIAHLSRTGACRLKGKSKPVRHQPGQTRNEYVARFRTLPQLARLPPNKTTVSDLFVNTVSQINAATSSAAENTVRFTAFDDTEPRIRSNLLLLNCSATDPHNKQTMLEVMNANADIAYSPKTHCLSDQIFTDTVVAYDWFFDYHDDPMKRATQACRIVGKRVAFESRTAPNPDAHLYQDITELKRTEKDSGASTHNRASMDMNKLSASDILLLALIDINPFIVMDVSVFYDPHVVNNEQHNRLMSDLAKESRTRRIIPFSAMLNLGSAKGFGDNLLSYLSKERFEFARSDAFAFPV